MLVAKSVSAINEQDIDIPIELHVLVSIIEHRDFSSKTAMGRLPRLMPVASDQDRGTPEAASQHIGLIARLLCGEQNILSIRHNTESSLLPALVTPTQNRNVHATLLQDPNDILHGGRLSRSSHGHVAYAHYLKGESLGGKDTPLKKLVSALNQTAIDRRQEREVEDRNRSSSPCLVNRSSPWVSSI
jgi:hypothetical protein